MADAPAHAPLDTATAGRAAHAPGSRRPPTRKARAVDARAQAVVAQAAAAPTPGSSGKKAKPTVPPRKAAKEPKTSGSGAGDADGGSSGGFFANVKTKLKDLKRAKFKDEPSALLLADLSAVPKAGPHVIHQGALEKKGQKRHNWAARFFVATQTTLTYYDRAPGADGQLDGLVEKGTLSLADPFELHVREAKVDWETRFAIVSAARTLELRAASLRDAETWMIALAGGRGFTHSIANPAAGSSRWTLAPIAQAGGAAAAGTATSTGTGPGPTAAVKSPGHASPSTGGETQGTSASAGPAATAAPLAATAAAAPPAAAAGTAPTVSIGAVAGTAATAGTASAAARARPARPTRNVAPTAAAAAVAQPSEAQPEAQSEGQSEAQSEAQPEAQSEAQSEAQLEAQPEAQSEAQLETQPDAETHVPPAVTIAAASADSSAMLAPVRPRPVRPPRAMPSAAVSEPSAAPSADAEPAAEPAPGPPLQEQELELERDNTHASSPVSRPEAECAGHEPTVASADLPDAHIAGAEAGSNSPAAGTSVPATAARVPPPKRARPVAGAAAPIVSAPTPTPTPTPVVSSPVASPDPAHAGADSPVAPIDNDDLGASLRRESVNPFRLAFSLPPPDAGLLAAVQAEP